MFWGSQIKIKKFGSSKYREACKIFLKIDKICPKTECLHFKNICFTFCENKVRTFGKFHRIYYRDQRRTANAVMFIPRRDLEDMPRGSETFSDLP